MIDHSILIRSDILVGAKITYALVDTMRHHRAGALICPAGKYVATLFSVQAQRSLQPPTSKCDNGYFLRGEGCTTINAVDRTMHKQAVA